MGEDKLGNKYFEIPANPSIGKRRNSRYFEPKVKDRFDQDLPSEWESWLRNRRENPPTLEEINRNHEILELTRKNAAEKGYIPKTAIQEKMGTFPRHEEYELMPGEKEDWKKEK
ncbi:unnamed protein product [Allacma fusca]|uniref:NADH dehydrogenase [ubiquinone] 1 alpha subcomplex assembly factor 2 n=1 Tax=Allacma fusca TaxID=39272 RepID=A0A8J2K3P7_9HEXA|nr:unnamed protein product [Allacma fusca]